MTHTLEHVDPVHFILDTLCKALVVMYDAKVKEVCVNMYEKIGSLRDVAGFAGCISKSSVHNWVLARSVTKRVQTKVTDTVVKFVAVWHKPFLDDSATCQPHSHELQR